MKIARSIGILYRLKKFYSESVLIATYNTSLPLLSLIVGGMLLTEKLRNQIGIKMRCIPW